jgi:hypothetical protein
LEAEDVRSRFDRYPDHYERSLPLAGGTARVAYSYTGAKVEREDGTSTPERFTYVETPADPSAPSYHIECAHDDGGRPRIIAVHIIGRGRDVYSSDLRRMRSLEDVVEAAWVAISHRDAFVIGDSLEEVSESIERVAAEQMDANRRTVRGLRRQVRRKVTPELLEEVAEVYRANLATGKPTLAVREHFELAESTASLYVKRARDAGLDMGDRDDG